VSSPEPAPSTGGPDTALAAVDPSVDPSVDVPAGLRSDPTTGPEAGEAPDGGDTGADAAGTGAGPSPAHASAGGAVDFRMALVSGVSLDLPSQHPSVVLREIDTPRRQLTFSIGMPDAVALSHAVRRIPTPRPLTHELMSDVLQRFDVDVVAVRIVGRTGSIYFAELDLRGRSGRSVHSCRPSDALTLALHQPVQVPILVDVRLLEGDDDVAPAGSAH